MSTPTPLTLPDGRRFPLLTGGERPLLESWLDFHRATLELKCAGLDDAQLRCASAEPSTLTLLGLLQHLTEVERNWFQRAFGDTRMPPVFEEQTGYRLSPERGIEETLAVWRREIARGREVCAGRSLDDVGRIPGHNPWAGTEVSLRWVYVHMIEEYARHNGHADIVRERIDGATGF
ncbi:DinB family protein [Streptomyces sp. RY43-2]|uniref:DinB family protein n=1 Tax=Streptomyces macrolidinus TaxID=2952607 RepID=A0ABT0Z804_9ACTN|nr:DinB family protein [Streptomyces macrolidinus]MCN9239625.1 DinB family protein [Streptomyces macrolidinus]